jgi:hypothetical protein
MDRKQFSQAELLVPDHVEARSIRSVIVKAPSIPATLEGLPKVQSYV